MGVVICDPLVDDIDMSCDDALETSMILCCCFIGVFGASDFCSFVSTVVISGMLLILCGDINFSVIDHAKLPSSDILDFFAGGLSALPISDSMSLFTFISSSLMSC